MKAWKVFWRDAAGRLQFEYYRHGSSYVPRGRWVRARRWPGFFCFRTRQQAERWRDPGKVVRAIEVRGINCEGLMRVFVGQKLTETYPPCMCVREMFVPPRRKGREG